MRTLCDAYYEDYYYMWSDIPNKVKLDMLIIQVACIQSYESVQCCGLLCGYLCTRVNRISKLTCLPLQTLQKLKMLMFT